LKSKLNYKINIGRQTTKKITGNTIVLYLNILLRNNSKDYERIVYELKYEWLEIDQE
jgi:hypothetical protein